MAALSNSKTKLSIYLGLLSIFSQLLLLVGIQDFPQLVVSDQSTIKSLPGFQGPLPFHLETGYVGVDEFEDVQLFYYFIKSERNPKEDPVILWLTGGPGCTSFTGLAYEIGPLYFKEVEYDGTLPRLVLNHNAWTKIASIIFLDLPVGTGFSYGRTSVASHSIDHQACAQALEFLRKWFISHPDFLSNPFYVGGDSYSGITVPIISQLISNENEAGIEQSINLKILTENHGIDLTVVSGWFVRLLVFAVIVFCAFGSALFLGYLLGNPKTFPAEDNYKIPFSHGMGLISDELFASFRRNCGLDYQQLDLNNAKCLRDLETVDQCCSGINNPHILEKKCARDSPQLRRSLSGERRALMERFRDQNNPKSLLSAFDCRVDGYWLSYHWFNDENVRKALHIREGTIETWIRCSSNLSYEKTTMDSRPYHVNLSRKGYRSLVYSGDHDLLVPFQSTQAWIRELNYSIIDDWRPWIVEGQYAGYTRAFSSKMTFATVKGGGHTAPEYRPQECYAMFKRWISHEPL